MPAQLARDGFDLGIVTADIEASLHFYRDLLGFVPLMVLDVTSGPLHLLTAGQQLVKLAEVHDAPAGPKGEIPAATGLRYVSFWVTNLDELHDELAAAGVVIAKPPFEVAFGTHAMLVDDPDGNVVELLEQR